MVPLYVNQFNCLISWTGETVINMIDFDDVSTTTAGLLDTHSRLATVLWWSLRRRFHLPWQKWPQYSKKPVFRMVCWMSCTELSMVRRIEAIRFILYFMIWNYIRVVTLLSVAVNALCDHIFVKAVTFVGTSRVAEMLSKRCRYLNKRVLALGRTRNRGSFILCRDGFVKNFRWRKKSFSCGTGLQYRHDGAG
jgi:hypothetical protein